jgi:hypothetical protein
MILIFALAGVLVDGPGTAFHDFIRLQLHPGRLINDFFAAAGIGGTLVNAAAVGLIGWLLIQITGVSFSGPTFAAVFTMMGFGLFGKTPVNILPVIAGVTLSARLVGKRLKDYLIIALFGTALGPLVSVVFLETGLPPGLGISLGILSGLGAGFLLPALAVAMLHLHQGYSLYNMGLTCGFLGLFAASVLKAAGLPFDSHLKWYDTGMPLLTLMVPALSVSLLLIALWKGREGRIWKGFLKIQKLPGRLPSDFVDMAGLSGAFLNAGLTGIALFALVMILGADFSGPVLGGILTVMGFATFGTHFRNSWSVLAGVICASLLFGKDLSSPGVILAILFGTTLGPLAGQFGVGIGFLAGFLPLILVSHTGSRQGGMNLYNNGFAGGLTAALIIAVIQWYKNNKDEG